MEGSESPVLTRIFRVEEGSDGSEGSRSFEYRGNHPPDRNGLSDCWWNWLRFFLGEGTPEPAPSASLSAETGGGYIYVDHDGGDTVADATGDLLVKLNGEDIEPGKITVGGSNSNLKGRWQYGDKRGFLEGRCSEGGS